MSSQKQLPMPNRKQLRDLLIQHEGERFMPYECPAGKLTIGVGRNLEANGISKEESDFLLDNDLARVHRELTNNFSWYYHLSDKRKMAMIDMAFNLGITRFKKFRRMISALDKGNYHTAAREMLDSRWAVQVGRRSRRLASMMREG